MERTFEEALRNRRSYYRLTDKSPVSDGTIKEVIEHALEIVPSAFNSRSTRIVLLLGEHHKNYGKSHWTVSRKSLRLNFSQEQRKKSRPALPQHTEQYSSSRIWK